MNIKLTMLAVGALLWLGAGPAASAPDEAMLARLKAFAAEQGSPIEWESVDEYEGAGGKMVTTLTNVRVGAGNEAAAISSLELSEVSEVDGGWRIGKLSVPYQRFREGEADIALQEFAVSGLTLPAEGQPVETVAYEGVSLREMTVAVNNVPVFSLNDLHVEITQDDAGTMEFAGAAEAFTISAGAVDDDTARSIMQAMGYEQLQGYLEIEGSWNPNDGALELAQYDITVNDVGTLGMNVALSGYTRDVMAGMSKAQADMAANPDGDNTASYMAMLGLMQRVNLHSARIQFVDDSVTNRTLDMMAEQQRADRKTVMDQAQAILLSQLMLFNNPQLIEQASEAVSTFLADPQNLAVAAEPAEPLPLAVAIMTGMAAPQALPQQLGLKFIANE